MQLDNIARTREAHAGAATDPIGPTRVSRRRRLIALAAVPAVAVVVVAYVAGARPPAEPVGRPPQAQAEADLRAEKVCDAVPGFDAEYQAVMVAQHGHLDLSTPDGYTRSCDPYLDGGSTPAFTLDEADRAVASRCPALATEVDTIRTFMSAAPDRGPLRQEPAGPGTVATLVGNGAYSAGDTFAGQMQPGTWQLRTEGRSGIKDCFYSRRAADGEEVIEQRYVVADDSLAVTLLDGELFSSIGCGLWEWTG